MVPSEQSCIRDREQPVSLETLLSGSNYLSETCAPDANYAKVSQPADASEYCRV